MGAHKFAIGQRVEFQPSGFDGSATRGSYVIVRQMPTETRDWQYRVKNVHDGHERVVNESQLSNR